LINPRDGKVWDIIDPRFLMQAVAAAAWRSGDPGVLFHDTINQKNTVPGLDPLKQPIPAGNNPSCLLKAVISEALTSHGVSIEAR
jgi:ribonucleoside-diphosphate reductase alpha chain